MNESETAEKLRDNWPLSVGETAEVLAYRLGELPNTWYQRLQNWRKQGRDAPLVHHQETGKRPCYMGRDIALFIAEKLKSRSLALGRSAIQSQARAIAAQHGIAVQWRTGGSDGRFHLNVPDALALGNQLVELAQAQLAATADNQEADNQG